MQEAQLLQRGRVTECFAKLLKVIPFKVVGNSTIRQITYKFLWTFHSNNYMALYCIISEIKEDIGRKSRFFQYPVGILP